MVEERRRPAAEEDGVGFRAIAGRANLLYERIHVLALQLLVEQATVEIAVIADVGAKGDMQVQAQHDNNELGATNNEL
jgi:hypothetical protein